MYIAGVYSQTQQGFHKTNIGVLKLESGKVINNCIIGYSKFGKPNADSSNIIVMFTWFAGKSDAYTFAFGNEGWIDTTKFHCIVIDAIGDGVSSSPSNVTGMDSKDFPEITIGDMVLSEYILLHEHLKLDHVYAMGGLSMGAFQTFHWIAEYPDYMDKAFLLSGTPAVSSFDLLFYNSILGTLKTGFSNKDIQTESYKNAIGVFTMNLFTPEYIQNNYKPDDFRKYNDEMINSYLGINIYDWALQMKALCTQNIFTIYGNSPEKTAAAIKAKTLIIVNKNDMIVNPVPSKMIAKQMSAEILELKGDCGHLASMCEGKEIGQTIREFLKR